MSMVFLILFGLVTVGVLLTDKETYLEALDCTVTKTPAIQFVDSCPGRIVNLCTAPEQYGKAYSQFNVTAVPGVSPHA